jgi:hypothetical protein
MQAYFEMVKIDDLFRELQEDGEAFNYEITVEGNGRIQAASEGTERWPIASLCRSPIDDTHQASAQPPAAGASRKKSEIPLEGHSGEGRKPVIACGLTGGERRLRLT